MKIEKKRLNKPLANQIKENELQEKKRQDEIAKIKKENEEEQKRLEQQANDIEKKKEEELAALALEDEEERQIITKRANEEKARIQRELDEKKRKDEEELKKKENQLFKERQVRELEIKKMEDDARIANDDARATEELLRQEKNKQADLYASQRRQYQARMNKGALDDKKQDNQEKALRSVVNYYVNEEEFNQSFQGGSYLRGQYLPQVSEIFAKYSSIRVNISKFFVNSGKNKVLAGTNDPWTYYLDSELQKTCSAVGSGWYTKSQLEERIRQVIGESF